MKTKNSLKDMLKEKKLIRIVGAHNGLTARLVERAGFEGIWASGFEISSSHAVPDANILTMTDFLDAAAEMVSTVSVPVIADCDTGFGNSNNAIHMVRRFEAAGVSAVCIEDKNFPKVNSFVPGRQELAPIAEFVGKIMAAKNARIKKDFMVFARVEALIAGWGHDEAIKRAEAYVKAGADGIFIHSKEKTPDEIIKFCKAWGKKAPVLISPTTYYLSEKDMLKHGISIVIYANQGLRAAVKYIKEVFGYMEKYGTCNIDSKIAPMEEVFNLQDMHIMKLNEKKYLRSDIGSIKAIIPAAGAKLDNSLKEILEDRPVAMLDINGKSLLQRNIETLNIAGIQDINVVVGYKGDKINLDNINIIKNPNFKTKGIMHSIFKGADLITDKNLILYSDILVDQYLLRNLLRKEGDIILVVDSTYNKTHFRNKELELVITKNSPIATQRNIDINRKNPITKIGKDLPEKDTHFEFIGVALLSKRGMSALLKEYESKDFKDGLSFSDLIQRLINKKQEVLAYEVSGGWMEVHNFNDYKNACSFFFD